MKKFLTVFVFISFMLVFSSNAYANPREGYNLAARIEIDGLTLSSYSAEWDEFDLYALYDELTNNFTSKEFSYLKAIYLYPDSPDGVLGLYYEDVSLDSKRNFALGPNAYIELFNADRKISVLEMAPVLSHEYGHHYTIHNMINYENQYYTGWKDSEYASIRFTGDEPVIFFNDYAEGFYNRSYDICEIAANDYVQLLGSELAKASYDYSDAYERLLKNLGETEFIRKHFNLRPQDNTEIPLAADVEGLYEYFLKIGGYYDEDALSIYLDKHPEILSITSENDFLNNNYTVYWSPAEGSSESYEYTVIMFPVGTPIMTTAVRTVSGAEELKAVLGTVSITNDDGSINAILDSYSGIYCFRVYVKDEKGFIHASNDFFYDFGEDNFDSLSYLDNITQTESPTPSAIPPAAPKAKYTPDPTDKPVVVQENTTPAVSPNPQKNSSFKSKSEQLPEIDEFPNRAKPGSVSRNHQRNKLVFLPHNNNNLIWNYRNIIFTSIPRRADFLSGG